MTGQPQNWSAQSLPCTTNALNVIYIRHRHLWGRLFIISLWFWLGYSASRNGHGLFPTNFRNEFVVVKGGALEYVWYIRHQLIDSLPSHAILFQCFPRDNLSYAHSMEDDLNLQWIPLEEIKQRSTIGNRCYESTPSVPSSTHSGRAPFRSPFLQLLTFHSWQESNPHFTTWFWFHYFANVGGNGMIGNFRDF